MRQRTTRMTLALAALLLTAPAGAADGGDHAGAGRRDRHDEETWSLHKETTVSRTFTLAPAGGRAKVEILNFHGKVTVHAGGGGSAVTLSLRQAWAADTEAKLEEAQRAVRLDVQQPDGGLRLVMDGPFRTHDGGIDFRGWRSVGYQARFDFDVEVPAGVDVVAKTVQGGAVQVSGLGGRFEADNVNGDVTLEAVSGEGRARTVNGSIKAAFSRNPGGGCTFSTINGQIDVSLRSGLGADLRFKTLNGEVYTDFPYTLRDLPPGEDDAPASSRPARFHYRSRGEFAARIGSGGPELAFSTINGNILIHRRDA